MERDTLTPMFDFPDSEGARTETRAHMRGLARASVWAVVGLVLALALYAFLSRGTP